ncbi:M56 family metallopeptidase [Dietzia maris]|uniref:M56 family metallopeptidase n=1 Tax=Dietzia maris TaxID=37915 RepID=A0AAE4R0L8_9ACTN|nr:M56 family metallopeptidase [Dietzia maris]MDV6300857.1 M56 family metallopeptidase [Dietzia maris]
MALLAVGPVLAWMLSGPAFLPTHAAAVCEQCLAAANPFGERTFDTGFPVAVLLVLPAAAVALHLASISVEAVRRRQGTLSTALRYRQVGQLRCLSGYDVLLVDDLHPFALSLPKRHGGIVVSTGAVNLLTPSELAAVLAHEYAHLQQRHHLITSIVGGLTTKLRWVPLLAAATEALGHYLEIAADDHARQVAGTPALASALFLLGEAGRSAERGSGMEGVLHALGPDRIGHLVQPRRGTAGMAAAATSACCLTLLIVLAASVHIPYALAVLSGCA